MFLSMTTKSVKHTIMLLFAVSVGMIFSTVEGQSMADASSQTMLDSKSTYAPKINPSDFTPKITNKFFQLTPGKTWVYESQTEQGTERIETKVLGKTKVVMSVKTVVVWNREWLNDQLIEDTMDYYAQDKKGNVWYFGEHSKEFEGGKLVSTKGSWEAGKDGAKPGIIVKSLPRVGDSYRQEYYLGRAEDMGEVVALEQTVSVPYGTLSGCLKTKDWTPLEPDVVEFKYYCPQVGGIALETIPADQEKVELVKVTSNDSQKTTVKSTKTTTVSTVKINQMIPTKTPTQTPQKTEPVTPTTPVSETQAKTITEITRERAIEIAKGVMPGAVGEVGTEYKFGQFAWVVEVLTSGGEVDVVIEKSTGKVLGIER